MEKYIFAAHPDPAHPEDRGSVLLAEGTPGGSVFRCYAINVRDLGDIAFSAAPSTGGGLNILTNAAADFVAALRSAQK